MSLRNYQIIKQIGKGSFGRVYLVLHRKKRRHFVLKAIPLTDPKETEVAQKEVKMLQLFNNPFIVQYNENFIDQKQFCIVMEYCDDGDLNQYFTVCKNKRMLIPETQVIDWFTQITLGLQFVHDQRVLHRDIKAQNIFLTKQGCVKLGDFGIARSLSNTHDLAHTLVGTPYYMSPELSQNKPYGFKSDIWALGSLLYEMCSLRHPFEARNYQELVVKIAKGSYPPIPPSYSSELSSLINSMLQQDPDKRPTCSDILSLPLIRSRMQNYLQESIGRKTPSHEPPMLHLIPKQHISSFGQAPSSQGTAGGMEGLDYMKKQLPGLNYGNSRFTTAGASSRVDGAHGPVPTPRLPEDHGTGTTSSAAASQRSSRTSLQSGHAQAPSATRSSRITQQGPVPTSSTHTQGTAAEATSKPRQSFPRGSQPPQRAPSPSSQPPPVAAPPIISAIGSAAQDPSSARRAQLLERKEQKKQELANAETALHNIRSDLTRIGAGHRQEAVPQPMGVGGGVGVFDTADSAVGAGLPSSTSTTAAVLDPASKPRPRYTRDNLVIPPFRNTGQKKQPAESSAAAKPVAVAKPSAALQRPKGSQQPAAPEHAAAPGSASVPQRGAPSGRSSATKQSRPESGVPQTTIQRLSTPPPPQEDAAPAPAPVAAQVPAPQKAEPPARAAPSSSLEDRKRHNLELFERNVMATRNINLDMHNPRAKELQMQMQMQARYENRGRERDPEDRRKQIAQFKEFSSHQARMSHQEAPAVKSSKSGPVKPVVPQTNAWDDDTDAAENPEANPFRHPAAPPRVTAHRPHHTEIPPTALLEHEQKESSLPSLDLASDTKNKKMLEASQHVEKVRNELAEIETEEEELERDEKDKQQFADAMSVYVSQLKSPMRPAPASVVPPSPEVSSFAVHGDPEENSSRLIFRARQIKEDLKQNVGDQIYDQVFEAVQSSEAASTHPSAPIELPPHLKSVLGDRASIVVSRVKELIALQEMIYHP